MRQGEQHSGGVTAAPASQLQDVVQFVTSTPHPLNAGDLPAVSLFSGAGLSDFGYGVSGFRFAVQAELDPRRAAIGKQNFPGADWIVGDIRNRHDDVVRAYRRKCEVRPALLVATPPCQGMSTSNASRGRRREDGARLHEEKNRLLLEVVPIAEALQPRFIVMENVRQIRTVTVKDEGHDVRLLDLLREGLGDEYVVFDGAIDVADFGVPQIRQRAIIVAVHVDERAMIELTSHPELPPWPISGGDSHARITLRQWLSAVGYESLDSSSADRARGSHPLHFVPHYRHERYRLIADIPRNSGRSAYQNSTCPWCGRPDVAAGLARCDGCAQPMYNRPIVTDQGELRLIKGFESSYRRMLPDQPAPTVTTASNHLGSDTKIHPWENRLLSLLETADIQTIPRSFDWSPVIQPVRGKALFNVCRDVVGEAFPPYFTYLHGSMLRRFILE